MEKIVRVKQMLKGFWGIRMASITIVADLNPNNSDEICIGIAFQSPQDNFCRKRGREIAMGRMCRSANFTVPFSPEVYENGKLTSEGLLAIAFDVLEEWDKTIRSEKMDPFKKECKYKRPRWFGDFLAAWEKGSSFPQLPMMPK